MVEVREYAGLLGITQMLEQTGNALGSTDIQKDLHNIIKKLQKVQKRIATL